MKFCAFFTVFALVASPVLARAESSPNQKIKELEVQVFAEVVEKLRAAKTVGQFFDGLSGSLKPAEIKELKSLAQNDVSLTLQVEELNERRVLIDVGGNQTTFEFVRSEGTKKTVYKINNYEFVYVLGAPLSEVASKLKSLLPQSQAVGFWEVILGAQAHAQEMWRGRTSIGAALVRWMGGHMEEAGRRVITQGCPNVQARVSECQAAKAERPRPLLQDMMTKLTSLAEFARQPGVQFRCSTEAREQSLQQLKVCIHELRTEVYQIPISGFRSQAVQAALADAEAHFRQAREASPIQPVRSAPASSRVAE